MAIVLFALIFATAKAAPMKCDGISDDSQAFAASAAAAQANQTALMIPPGTCLLNSGLTITLAADLSISGSGTLKVNAGVWPYPKTAWLDIDANGHAFSLAGVTLDQSWKTSLRGRPAGFSDGTAPSTWGDDWTIRVSRAAGASITRVTFINIMRGIYFLDSGNIVAKNNTFRALAVNATSLWAFENCSNVLLDSNSHMGISWLDSATDYSINGEYSWNSSHLTFRNNVWHGLQIVNRCGTVGACTDILYDSNTIDTPVADTSTGNFQRMVSRGNRVSNSGDMGITCDNCNFVEITGNTIDGVANGGIAVSTGKVAATGSAVTSIDIRDNTVVNPVQDYPAVQKLSGRRSASAGEWASCISIYTQPPADTVSTNATISGNRCTMTAAPPVSDSAGLVRETARGIVCGVTTNPTPQTCVIRRNVVKDETGLVPGFIIYAADRRIAGNYRLTGAPRTGEVFTCPETGNSFVMIAIHPPHWLWAKGLRNDSIGGADRFFGADSKAAITFSQAPTVDHNGVTFESNEEGRPTDP